MSTRLVICVFACVTVDRYAQEVKKITSTWGSNLPASVKVLFFLGEERVPEFSGDQYIYLPGVMNDYMSASYKQFLGLKYTYENYNPDFTHCCGTDTFINIPKMLWYLERLPPEQPLYIGGHGDIRQLKSGSYYYHSGGPGFILSNASLKEIHPICDNAVSEWIVVCNESNKQEYIPYCDLAISYLLQTMVKDLHMIKTYDSTFIHCNHIGHPCHKHLINFKQIIACHNMTLNDFDEFYSILIKNRFFM